MDFLRVGVISNTHGIKGEVKVFPTTDDPERFEELEKAFIVFKGEYKEVSISSVKYFKQFVILKFKEYNDINDILKFKGCDLVVDRENAVPLEENEYFICDLIGLKVVTEDGDFGVLKDVLTGNANDVYVVDHEGREVLLPVIDECILDVNIKEGFIKAHIMKGLLD